MRRQGEVPQDFKGATTIYLYKRIGNRQLYDNHRGICLLNIAGKIFAHILLNSLSNHLDQGLLSKRQCGFRRYRGTMDRIFATDQLQENCQEMRTHLVVKFNVKVRARPYNLPAPSPTSGSLGSLLTPGPGEGFSDTRFSEQGQLEEVAAGYTFFCSGRSRAKRQDTGVISAIRNDIVGRLPCLPLGMNDRLMTLRFPHWGGEITILVNIFAPPLSSPDETRNKFYAELHTLPASEPTVW
ncbi:hypothetical protein SprV_1002901300 [Sparganum proliferum]